MSDDVLKQVDSLLKEQERYQSWLQRLEDEKSQASERSYERVRADYQTRLEEVADKLRAHGDAVRERLGEVGQTVVELEVERAARQEEFDEARLRNSVGEYTDADEWAELESGLQESLSEAEKRLEAAEDEVARLKQIVAQLAGAEQEPELEQLEPEPGPEAQLEPEPELGEPVAVAPNAGSPEVEPEAEPDEGFVFLEDLVAGDDDMPQAEPQPSTAIEGFQAGASAGGAQPAGAGDGGAGEGGGGGEGGEGGEGELGDEMAFLESLSLDAGGDSESFSFLEGQGRGTPQTIICPHCSAANDPVEWYCTECGEELPAE